MVLFRVASHIQFITAVMIAMQVENDEADIHLLDTTDFSNFKDKIERTGVFRKVLLCKDRDITNDLYSKTATERKKLIHNLPDFWEINLDCQYDKYYMGHDAFANKLFYYYLIKQQKAPEVYVLEDGLASYAHDIYAYAMADDIDHLSYKDKNILNHIQGQFLYQPDLFLGKQKFNILDLPEFEEHTKSALRIVYGEPEIPKERFIIFTSCFSDNRVTTNELDLVQMVTREVGKENVTIKCHPRAQYNPYQMRGFNIMPRSDIPWEAFFLLDRKIENKVLISASSYATFTAHAMFKKDVPVIFLYNMLKGNFKMVVDSEFVKFIVTLTDKYNHDVPQVFCPTSLKAFKDIMKYIESRWPGESD